MHPLAAIDILHIWDRGQAQHPLERALTLLGAALPNVSRSALAALTVGERDGLLVRLRALTFGPRLNGFAACPRCAERLEFALDLPAADGEIAMDVRHMLATVGADLSPDPSPRREGGREMRSPAAGGHARLADESGTTVGGAAGPDQYTLTTRGYEVRFRLPTSLDLAAAAACASPREARDVLARRCVVDVTRRGVQVHLGKLPEQLVTRLAARMAECEPGAELVLDLTCPACGYAWQTLLDIASFLWEELAVQAKRVLREVHALATAYGWSEAEIVALSPHRRRAYLELAGA